MSHDDAWIMQQVQLGQLSLFEELVLRYRSALIRVAASKLGDGALAEDVVQETFLAVFAARHSFDPRFAFRTWLWTILLNRCRKHLRRETYRRRETALPASVEENGFATAVTSAEEPALARLLAVEQQERLHALLEELPEPQADALRLRFFGGLKFQEIADAMECSLNGAKQRVRIGLLRLAGLMNDETNDGEGLSHDV